VSNLWEVAKELLLQMFLGAIIALPLIYAGYSIGRKSMQREFAKTQCVEYNSSTGEFKIIELKNKKQ
jgi:hypothetical protein